MALVSITYNGTSIQTSNIQVKEILHESMDNKLINIQKFGARDGGKIVSEIYDPRKITMSGIITGSTQADLESRIDSFKQTLNEPEKNLDIAYNSGTRRYKASCRSCNVYRSYFNVTYAEFEVEFVISNPPFGSTLDTSTVSFAVVQVGTGTYSGSLTLTGTRRPMPTIKMTVNSETNLTLARFKNIQTGGQIVVAASFAASDVLLVNTDDYTVTLNGVAQNYSGFFPEFIAGSNDVKFSFRSDRHDVTIKLIYYPLYL